MLATTPQTAAADIEPYGTTTVRSYIEDQAIKNGVDPKLAIAIVECESGFVSQQSRHIQKDGSQERSYGVWQINIDHNDVTIEQASSTVWGTGWAMQQLKEGRAYLWTCYKNGAGR